VSGSRARGRPAPRGVPVLAIVGGLLGAGKTTLILAAGKRLVARGLRVGVITNDQGHGLVDTALVQAAQLPVREVPGGCFCCRLSDLMQAAESLEAARLDVIFAEPVGSCLDLAATVLRPIMRDRPGRFRVAPLTVLVDPCRARELALAGADDNLTYLFQQQLAEADVVCTTKADTDPGVLQLPGIVAGRLSARTGEGVEVWLDHLLGCAEGGRGRLLVDYERYAAAESALAWLNWHSVIQLTSTISPVELVGRLCERLDVALTQAGMTIAHVKLLDQTASGYVRASLSQNRVDPVVDGMLDAPPTRVHRLLLNARVVGDPALMTRLVSECLADLSPRARLQRADAFRPSAPVPQQRA
jgi:hypothetical protein